MMSGALLPLIAAGGAPTYAAVFSPARNAMQAVASLSRAGAGWRLLRVLADHPVPILIVAHTRSGGAWPAALLLPVPDAPVCQFFYAGR